MDIQSFACLKKLAAARIAGSPSKAATRWTLLGDSSTQFLKQALVGSAWSSGWDLEIQEAPHGQIEQFILSRELAEFEPQALVLSLSTAKLLEEFQSLPSGEHAHFSERKAARILAWLTSLQKRFPQTQVFVTQYSEWDDGVFGSGATRIESSFLFQTRSLVLALMKASAQNPALHLIDAGLVQTEMGADGFRDSRLAYQADLQFSLDATARIAQRTLGRWNAIQGRARKCLILDLDNTTWGGIIADVGVEGIEIGSDPYGKPFTSLQKWAKQLRERGVLLAVCSKNEEKTAKSAFIEHPEMVLRLEDIAVFVANYQSKADNVRYIQKVLNIGFDSMVFLDDSPFERGIVKEQLPEVCVPELPEDPASYVDFLRQLHLFEAVTLTAEDEKRTGQYQLEAQRNELQFEFTDENDFLKSLDMEATVTGLTDFLVPRVAQLSQRSNQFNLRTVRYTEDQLKKIADDASWISLNFSLKDRFGDYGMISSVLLRALDSDRYFIDTWIMSCRVLKRGVEQLVLNEAAKAVSDRGAEFLVGEYLPTAKNGLVKDHYSSLGFVEESGTWSLDLTSFERRPNWIRVK